MTTGPEPQLGWPRHRLHPPPAAIASASAEVEEPTYPIDGSPAEESHPAVAQAQKCAIKGNLSRSGERIFHVPDGQFYSRTKIDEGAGERWFCSEQEAVAAGWRRSMRQPMTMTILPLLLDPAAQARTILHHLLQHGDIAGRDTAGRTVITLAVDRWLLKQLLTFDAGSEDLEDGGDGEPDDEPED
jgi:hypothetical protein